MPDHVVTKGECLNSIAFHYGFFWEVLWNEARNQALRSKRESPNTLVPGDVVFVPEKRLRLVNCQTGQTHMFQIKGVPALFRVQAFDGNEPRADQAYELTIDGVKHVGTSDTEGYLQAPMSPKAKKAVLVIGPNKDQYEFALGELEPVTEIAGVQARLNNLGYECGEVTGAMNEATTEALLQFQRFSGLQATGKPDEATQSKLTSLHDQICDLPDGDEEQAEEDDEEYIEVTPEV